ALPGDLCHSHEHLRPRVGPHLAFHLYRAGLPQRSAAWRRAHRPGGDLPKPPVAPMAPYGARDLRNLAGDAARDADPARGLANDRERLPGSRRYLWRHPLAAVSPGDPP